MTILDENEEALKYRELATQYDLEYLKAILDFSKFSIKALFLLNGSAAIAMMTLITNILIKNPDLSIRLLNPVSYFAWGAVSALLTIIPGYLAHIFCKNKEWEDNKLICSKVHTRASMKRINEFIKKIDETNDQNEKHKISKEVIDEMRYQEDCEPLLKGNVADYMKNKRYTIVFVILAIVCLAISFYSFIEGISNTKASFSLLSEEETEQQISYSDLSYPCVEITPLPLTKPN